MKNYYEKYINGLKQNNLDNLNEFVGEFTNSLLTDYIKGDSEKVKLMIDEYSEIREQLDDEIDIERNISFYYGFLYANEYIMKNILNETAQIEKTFANLNSKKHVKNMFIFINDKGLVNHKELSEYLNVSKSRLTNLINELSNSNEKLFYKEKIGKNIYYSLSIRGKNYCEMLKKHNETLSIEEIIQNVSKALIYNEKPKEKDSLFVYESFKKIMEEVKIKDNTKNKLISLKKYENFDNINKDKSKQYCSYNKNDGIDKYVALAI